MKKELMRILVLKSKKKSQDHMFREKHITGISTNSMVIVFSVLNFKICI